MKKTHLFQIPMYDATLLLVLDKKVLTEVVMKSAGEKVDTTRSMGKFYHLANDTTNCLVVGWFDDKISTLCHELLHAAMSLWVVGIGAKPKQLVGEPFAYMYDSFIQMVFKVLPHRYLAKCLK